MNVRMALVALALSLAACGAKAKSDADPDLATATKIELGGSSVLQANADGRGGQTLVPPRYLPAWGPLYPGSQTSSKLVQTFQDGKRSRVTNLIAPAPAQTVIQFYRDAIARAGRKPEEQPSGERRMQFTLGPGNGHASDGITIQDQGMIEADGEAPTYRTAIIVVEALGPEQGPD